MNNDGGGGGGRRSRRYEFGGETNASTAGLTLGGILSINETAPYRIHNRTLLDLIRDDEITGKDSKKTWKMFREKLRLKLVGSVCTTTVPILASHVHIITSGNRTTARNETNRSNSPPVDNNNNNNNNNNNINNNNNTSSVPDTQTAVENRTDGGGDGEPATVKMSLMALLEVDGSGYLDDDDDDDDDVKEKAVAEEGDGDGYRYNNCCVCMVRHKGAAFIPCGHTFCRHCSRELFVKRANCPLCNNFILEILDIF